MTELIDAVLLLIGMFFILVSSIGLLRMPDLMTRMHAATKAGTVGVGFVLLAVANHFATLSVVVEAIVIIIFLFSTAPVGAHLIGRAAYIIGVRLHNPKVDELDAHYLRKANSLSQNRSDLYDPVRFFARSRKVISSVKEKK